MAITDEAYDTDMWYSDSGATHHQCGNINWFSSIDQTVNIQCIRGANGQRYKPQGIGTVNLIAYVHGQWVNAFIDGVHYTPGCANLYSESQTAAKGYTIIRDINGAFFYNTDTDEFVPEAECVNGSYIMKFRQNPGQVAMLAKEENGELIHRRLGHVNMRYIVDSIRKNVVDGLVLPSNTDIFCDKCIQGKMARLPFKRSSEKRQFEVGEMFHVDLAGKFRHRSLSGAAYFLQILDDASGLMTTYFPKLKSDVPDCIIDYITMIECQTGHRVKVMKSDYGTEFVNSKVHDYFRKHGITKLSATEWSD